MPTEKYFYTSLNPLKRHFEYWSLHRRKALALRAKWVSMCSGEASREAQRNFQKRKSVSLCTGNSLLGVQFITSLESNLCRVLTGWHTS